MNSNTAAGYTTPSGTSPLGATIYVDGKYVERWKREGDNVLERIIDDAAANPGK